jgi:hypothetical protein
MMDNCNVQQLWMGGDIRATWLVFIDVLRLRYMVIHFLSCLSTICFVRGRVSQDSGLNQIPSIEIGKRKLAKTLEMYAH